VGLGEGVGVTEGGIGFGVGVGDDAGVGVHVGGKVGTGTKCVRVLLVSSLSATRPDVSTVAVFSPAWQKLENQNDTSCPAPRPCAETRSVVFTSTTKGEAGPFPALAITTRRPSTVDV